MRTFILHMYVERLKYYSLNVEGKETYKRLYAAVHLDLISPVLFNSSLERVILVKLIKPLSLYSDSVWQPVKYYPIRKQSFQTIKVKITNENLKPIFFVDDTSRICLVLHIRPIKHDF